MNLNIQILEANYWENFKFTKEISHYLPCNHPKRLKIEKQLNEQLTKLNEFKNKNV